LNLTPDSFSDGNQYLDVEKACQQATALVHAGAEIIDIGAESTSPKATAITAETEWQRLQPFLQQLTHIRQACLLTPTISLDTRYSKTADHALAHGIDWINDVTGLDDLAMRDIVRSANIDCVVMHHKSIPERRHNTLPRAL